MVSRVLKTIPGLRFSISYTTRAPRGVERDGVEYFFVDESKFRSLIQQDELLEWAEVHGHFYGTSQRHVDEMLRQGEDVILDIDVQGAGIIRRKRPDAVSVFILPPSFEVLRERLLGRSLDAGFVIEKRLKIAREEIRHYKEYEYLIINKDLDSSVLELESIIRGARCRMEARSESARSILATFGGMDAEDP